MDKVQLETEINAAWDDRDNVSTQTGGAVREAVMVALDMLDSGAARVAEPLGDHPNSAKNGLLPLIFFRKWMFSDPASCVSR